MKQKVVTIQQSESGEKEKTAGQKRRRVYSKEAHGVKQTKVKVEIFLSFRKIRPRKKTVNLSFVE